MTRLRSAVENSRRVMEAARDRRVELLRQYVGSNFTDNGAPDKVPLPLLGMAVTIYTQFLAAQVPRVMVSTKHKELMADASDLELAMNYWMEDSQFDEPLSRWVLDALFSMGIMKTGLGAGKVVEIDGRLIETGTPFADTVDLDNFVYDTSSKRWKETAYLGDYYELPTDAIRDSDLYNAKARKKVVTNDGDRMEGDAAERADEMGDDEGVRHDTYYDKTYCLDLWLRRENLIVTVDALGDWETPLRITDWTGPEHGCYHRLAFDDVPGNILPLSPLSTILDLHDLANRLWNKLGRQAEREKNVGLVQSGDTEDAKKLLEAGDGEYIPVSNPNLSSELHTGGINNASAAFALMLKDLFVYFGGNLDSLGGLSPMASTFGQDKMLADAASKRMEGMQKRVMRGTKRIIHDIANYLYTDPLISLPLTRKIPGMEDMSIQFNWTPERRRGDFLLYNFDIDPYSMEYQSPATQLARLTQVVTQYVVPLMPLLSQQQIGLNAEWLMKQVGKLAGIRDADQLLIYGAGEMQPGGGPIGDRPMKSPVTHRINERVNRPGAQSNQKDSAMIQMLMAGNGPGVQPKEQTSLRAVG